MVSAQNSPFRRFLDKFKGHGGISLALAQNSLEGTTYKYEGRKYFFNSGYCILLSTIHILKVLPIERRI